MQKKSRNFLFSTPGGLEPPTSDPKSDALSIKLQAHENLKNLFLYIFIYIIVSTMNSVLVLKTEITTTTVEFVSNYLKDKTSKTVAICNANTLVDRIKILEFKKRLIHLT